MSEIRGFTRATKKAAKLRLALLGPAGSGKTFSALKIGRALIGPEGRIAVLDTEHGSASKYSDLHGGFDSLEPDTFSVDTYIEAIEDASNAGYDLLILDSLSHAWAGKGGILEFVDNVAKRSGGNSFGAWRDATPKHNQLIDAMLASRLHLIVTMRVKMEYVQEKDEKGKTTIRKVGLQPVQRDGLEYEFDVVGDLTSDCDLIVSKTRCPELKGKIFPEPGENVAKPLREWLQGIAVDEKPRAPAFRPVTMDGEAVSGNGSTPAPAKPAPTVRIRTKATIVEERYDELLEKGPPLGVIGKPRDPSWSRETLTQEGMALHRQIQDAELAAMGATK